MRDGGFFDFEIDDGIAVARMNRPPANAGVDGQIDNNWMTDEARIAAEGLLRRQ